MRVSSFLKSAVLFCVVLAAAAQAATTISTTVTGEGRSITFTWTFETCEKGQFASGDWWVAPAAGQSSVTLTSLKGAGSGPIYCDENPQIESMGLLSKDYGNLDAAENIIPKLPVTYAYNTSLVAVIQRDEASFGGCGTKAILGACVDAYDVMTVLDTVPEDNGANTLRPNVTEDEKELLTWDDIDLTRLPALDFLRGTDAEGLANIRQAWCHHMEVLAMRDVDGGNYSEGGRAFRADLVLDDYGATIAQAWHGHMMHMMSDDFSFEGSKAALAAMLSYGKDIFYQVYRTDGTRERWFGVGAGQSIGRFPPAAFFAALCKDPFYADVLKQASTTQIDLGTQSVHEFDQINYGHNGPTWGDGGEITEQDIRSYWGALLKKQTFDGASGNYPSVRPSNRTARDPYRYIDGPPEGPGGAYMSVSGGPTIAFAAEMYAMPEMCEIANYDPLIVYVNRILYHGILSAPDPCAPPDPREDPAVCAPWTGGTACKYYGVTWGPDPDSMAAGNLEACIHNGTDPLTGEPQQGRYASRNGNTYTPGYTTSQVMGNWGRFILGRSRSTCRRDTSAIIAVPEAVAVPVKAPFTVYPNPSTGYVRISGPDTDYRVYDHSGAFVTTVQTFAILPQGVYFIAAPEQQAVQRVVIVE